MKKYFYTFLMAFSIGFANAQISITDQSLAFSENFDTLGTVGSGPNFTFLPDGWWIMESIGTNDYKESTGSSTTGDTYSFGQSPSDRALGGVASSTNQSNFGVAYINKSTSPFSSFSFDLYLEQWRVGGSGRFDTLYFYYGINNGGSLSGTWTKVSACTLISLDTSSTASVLNGNDAAKRKFYSFTITGMTINVDDTLYLRWRDVNITGSDDGLAIDDYNFTIGGTLPVSFIEFNAAKAQDHVLLNWSTANEVNNDRFDVERNSDGNSFETIGTVKGKGTTTNITSYEYTDATNFKGTSYYRLKQIDKDGTASYSKIVSINFPEFVTSIPNISPNPVTDHITVSIPINTEGSVSIELLDLYGKTLSTVKHENIADQTIDINTSYLPEGVYFLRIHTNGEISTQKIIKK